MKMELSQGLFILGFQLFSFLIQSEALKCYRCNDESNVRCDKMPLNEQTCTEGLTPKEVASRSVSDAKDEDLDLKYFGQQICRSYKWKEKKEGKEKLMQYKDCFFQAGVKYYKKFPNDTTDHCVIYKEEDLNTNSAQEPEDKDKIPHSICVCSTEKCNAASTPVTFSSGGDPLLLLLSLCFTLWQFTIC